MGNIPFPIALCARVFAIKLPKMTVATSSVAIKSHISKLHGALALHMLMLLPLNYCCLSLIFHLLPTHACLQVALTATNFTSADAAARVSSPDIKQALMARKRPRPGASTEPPAPADNAVAPRVAESSSNVGLRATNSSAKRVHFAPGSDAEVPVELLKDAAGDNLETHEEGPGPLFDAPGRLVVGAVSRRQAAAAAVTVAGQGLGTYAGGALAVQSAEVHAAGTEGHEGSLADGRAAGSNAAGSLAAEPHAAAAAAAARLRQRLSLYGRARGLQTHGLMDVCDVFSALASGGLGAGECEQLLGQELRCFGLLRMPLP